MFGLHNDNRRLHLRKRDTVIFGLLKLDHLSPLLFLKFDKYRLEHSCIVELKY